MPKAMIENVSSMSIARLLMLIVEISNHDSNKVVSCVEMSWAMVIVKVSVKRRRRHQLISESFWCKNQNWFKFCDVKMNEGNGKGHKN
jgi:hypothetical protein